MEFVFVNTHLKPRGLDDDEAESLEVLIQTIKDTVGKNKFNFYDKGFFLRIKSYHHFRKF
jgi:hypothetical protein